MSERDEQLDVRVQAIRPEAHGILSVELRRPDAPSCPDGSPART